ncbi:hypothetical protein EDM57_04960 [Brevibacillus gelatini]|uniref:Uncharacterized protein n=1 Tax=Brevibacillus gelatini TaxID=1655277 RepID=A0A3M8B858_9BACL|nr:hypothetical protein [Brevibacillus gelatini]RNB59492.1 hypothetical protein EDM57_04960 [Brevibacillus gelatini]
MQNAATIEYIGRMIMHPVTSQIVKEDDFQMFSDWATTNFIYAENCEEIVTEDKVTLVGFIAGEKFEIEMPIEDYFEGKSFTIENEIEMTTDDVIEQIEYDTSAKVVKNKVIKNYNHVQLNGVTIFSFRVKGNKITVFPTCNHFSNTDIFETDLEQLISIILDKQREVICQ